MNTLMWEHPTTARHLRQLATDATNDAVPQNLDLLSLVDWVNTHCPKLKIVPPQSKRLACDDVGMGAMAALDAIVNAVPAS
jgi:phosphopantothenoylcysteine decarboxylase